MNINSNVTFEQQVVVFIVPLAFSDLQLKNTAFDIWLAGYETTSSTLQWALALLIHSPHVQEKAQAELDRVVGGADELIRLTDKPRLPYMNALVNVSPSRLLNCIPFSFRLFTF